MHASQLLECQHAAGRGGRGCLACDCVLSLEWFSLLLATVKINKYSTVLTSKSLSSVRLQYSCLVSQLLASRHASFTPRPLASTLVMQGTLCTVYSDKHSDFHISPFSFTLVLYSQRNYPLSAVCFRVQLYPQGFLSNFKLRKATDWLPTARSEKSFSIRIPAESSHVFSLGRLKILPTAVHTTSG